MKKIVGTVASNVVKPLVVGMTEAKFVMKGTPITLKSGPLTICTAMVAEVHQAGKHVGTLMVHQGNGEPRMLRSNSMTELKKELGSTDNIQLKNPIVQTAPDTKPADEDIDTRYELAEAMDGLIDQGEILRNAEIGPGAGPLQTEMTANIKEDGSFDVPKRKGMFECVIQ